MENEYVMFEVIGKNQKSEFRLNLSYTVLYVSITSILIKLNLLHEWFFSKVRIKVKIM